MAKKLRTPRLSPDCTVESALDDLAEPVEYVRRVFKAMGHERASQVRLAFTSHPGAPDYRLEEFMTEPEDATDPDDHGHPMTVAEFKGRGHGELPYEKGELHQWSSAAMTWVQVQKLLGRLRGR